ncbi:filamentous hemagglutinin N-terminal domain-containing protein, partial [Escherichia coli]
QNSQNMVANWNSFDIGKGNTVQFYQPNSSAVALNRVVGGGESKIMGNLKANGQVFLVNPNGVLFGKDASVSTSGFVASTRDIKNDDFMNRRYTFSGGQKAGAEIVNQGALTTNAGGYIVLAADKVSNSGTIRTPGGKTVLAAGERVTLQLDNGGLTSVQVSGDVVNALVENRGLISARDGQVYLTAHGRDMLMNTVLNVSGVVEAGGMHRQDGNIVLDGGDSGVVHLSGTLQADNASGQGGKVVVQGQNILLDKGSSITATGGLGGGEVYIGGGWQGKDSSIRNADKVVMKDGARIDVSATQQGNGGTAVLWSESFTNFRGQISAKGGENGGNGGQVETSSHGNLQAFGSVSASAKKGKAGNWLLDPLDITIVNGSSSSVTESSDASGFEVSPSASGSQVSNTSIINELNNGTSVTVLTSSTTAGGNQKGNITVNADINKTGGANATLTLKADGNINVNKNITSTAGKLNVNLAAANTSSTGTITLGNNVSITTNGGDITAGTANASNSVTINVTGTTLNTSSGSQAGNITLNGSRVNVTNANITAGNFTLNATANGSNLNNVTLMATHDIILTGNNTTGVGLQLNGTNTLNATNGSISLTGNSTNGTGLFLGGNKTLSASNGSINLTGSSTSGVGLYLGENNSTNTLTATNGNISLNGVSETRSAIEIRGNNTLTADNINLTGNSTKSFGIDAQGGANTLNAANGSINLTGNSTNGTGLQLKGTNTLNATNGSISLTGNSTNGTGLFLGGNKTLSASNGSINLTGSSTKGVGLYLGENNSTNTLNATNGSINLNGVSVAGVAVQIRGTNTLTADNINLTGNSTNGMGIDVQWASNTLTATNGSINLTGNSTNGTGLQLKGTNTLTASNGSVNINGTVESNESAVNIGGDTTVHAINGNININGTVNKLFTGYGEKAGVRLNGVTLNASNGTVNINGSVNSMSGDPDADAFKAGVILGPSVNILALNSYINGTISGEYGFGVALGSIGSSNTEINISGNASINGFSSGNKDSTFGVAFGFRETILNVNNGTLSINGTSDRYGVATKPVDGQWASTKVAINLENANVTIFGCGSVAGVFFARHDNSAPYSPSGLLINGGTGNISGHSDTGVGVVLGGSTNINGVTVNGTSNTGTGVIINGEANVINASVNGNSNGTGVSITGAVNITGSTVTGNATGNGNGVNISG